MEDKKNLSEGRESTVAFNGSGRKPTPELSADPSAEVVKWKRRALAFQRAYREASFEVTALQIQLMDLRAYGADQVTARNNESLRSKLTSVCVERNEANAVAERARDFIWNPDTYECYVDSRYSTSADWPPEFIHLGDAVEHRYGEKSDDGPSYKDLQDANKHLHERLTLASTQDTSATGDNNRTNNSPASEPESSAARVNSSTAADGPLPVQGTAIITECCNMAIGPDCRYCPKCGYEARVAQPTPSTAAGDVGKAAQQLQVDVSNLRFYAEMAQQFKWETDIIDCGVVQHTLSKIADDVAALRTQLAAAEAQVKELCQQVEDTIAVAKTDEDADGFISAYHFQTGAIHRLLAMVRKGEGHVTREELSDFKREMEEKTIPAIVRAVQKRDVLAEDARHRTMKPSDEYGFGMPYEPDAE